MGQFEKAQEALETYLKNDPFIDDDFYNEDYFDNDEYYSIMERELGSIISCFIKAGEIQKIANMTPLIGLVA